MSGNETNGASLKVHIFSMSCYQKKPSILGESRASRADSCVFQVSLKITSSLSYHSLKIRRRNNRGNLLVFAVLRWEDERVIESSSNLFESMQFWAYNGALISIWCPIFTSIEFTEVSTEIQCLVTKRMVPLWRYISSQWVGIRRNQAYWVKVEHPVPIAVSFRYRWKSRLPCHITA